MRVRIAAVGLALCLPGGIFADTPKTYADAQAMWLQNRDSPSYQGYAAEFAQFNNHFHLDEKDGCYALASGPVTLMLIISHPGSSEFAVIEQVLSDVDNAKSRCFEKSYRGLHTKIPPFIPFVLQMSMR